MYSMQQSPSEANQFAACQEIPRILWNLKVHYHIYCDVFQLVIAATIRVGLQFIQKEGTEVENITWYNYKIIYCILIVKERKNLVF